MKQNSRLRPNEEHAAAGEQTHQTTAASGAAEFDSPEALLRHDAVQTPVPPEVTSRLRASLEFEPAPPPTSWWRRLLGL